MPDNIQYMLSFNPFSPNSGMNISIPTLFAYLSITVPTIEKITSYGHLMDSVNKCLFFLINWTIYGLLGYMKLSRFTDTYILVCYLDNKFWSIRVCTVMSFLSNNYFWDFEFMRFYKTFSFLLKILKARRFFIYL